FASPRRFPSTRSTASPSIWCFSSSCPSRRPSSICGFSPSSRRCSATATCASDSPPIPTLAPSISTLPPGSRMLQISVAQLYEDNREKLGLAWMGGKAGAATLLHRDSAEVAALVGHLNLIHPNRIQVLGNHEIAHLAGFEEADLFRMLGSLFAVHPAAIIVADGAPTDVRLLKAAEAAEVAVLVSDLP